MNFDSKISFWLNDEIIELEKLKSDQTLLDFLRLEKTLRGTKEGCAEGDCGACTVLVGRLKNGKLRYQAVNACISFVASLHGTHIVTIEHLKSDQGLHPIQQAMVEHHGSQCGFCTPGFVMSLYAMWMENADPTTTEIEEALQGNLCRCTGYQPIVKAARNIVKFGSLEQDFLVKERQQNIDRLQALQNDSPIAIESDGDKIFVPKTKAQLAEIYVAHPDATLVAGATDVGLWVTKFMRPITPSIFLTALRDFDAVQEKDGQLIINGGVTYTDLLPLIDEKLTQLSAYWRRIGGAQVRNMGTIGGNIANGSPIGETPPALIALGATITLQKGEETRQLPLEKFFIEYRKQDRAPGEFLAQIQVPLPKPEAHFAAYKISKRRDEDISAVAAAFHLETDGNKIGSLRIAYGGMAGVPKRADNVEAALNGQPLTRDTFENALDAFDQDFTPMTDMRASAAYRQQVAKNLLLRFYDEYFGEAESLDTLRQAALVEVN
ncbi:xanthine dehydrogenase small subunit [Maritalea mobilis]|uniref:Xanthine dehydrogenase small subunit n=1 Tax=Maritalea mobilis TaxID=483324 RepID=A0A4R6VK03_9HYPH|nr:xanthine dehydrogenase small subunit [Maritalea mobilis]TDQ61956.1 xanthine dehydrogenase small subunit [Maritalea mobilis]